MGIILDKWHPNANNGLVKGVQYFKAPPGRGYFVKRSLIIENMGSASGPQDSGGISANAPMPKVNFKIGDRVRLARGKTGIVRFMGATEFAKGEVIGLQLDQWIPAGHNGTVRGKKYFESQNGRGYFTRRTAISNVVIPLVKPLRQRRMSIAYKLHPLQIGDRIRFIAENNQTTFGKSGIIRCGYFVISVGHSLIFTFSTMNLFSNKYRYIGYPQFADGEVIGVELDQWTMNAHDGSANGEQIFDVPIGRGIFGRRDEMVKYDPEKEKLEEKKRNLKLGDTVILTTSNRRGHIKFRFCIMLSYDHIAFC